VCPAAPGDGTEPRTFWGKCRPAGPRGRRLGRVPAGRPRSGACRGGRGSRPGLRFPRRRGARRGLVGDPRL